MTVILQSASEKILERKEEIAHLITVEQNKKFPDLLESLSNDLLPMRIELVTVYAKALALDDVESEQEIKEWGIETGEECARIGTTLDAMLSEVPHYRNFIGEVLKEYAIEQGMGIEELYEMISKLDYIMNLVVYYFSVPYVNYQTNLLEQSRKEILELSAPVVPIMDGVAVLPLIGTIDTYRAKLIMEESLHHSVNLNLNYFVIDLSGVPIVDTFVIQQLFQIIEALKLVGVEARISGIKPEIALSVVKLETNFGQANTYSTLKRALADLVNMS
ncbi:STAS domain-containing protein [Alkalihalobacillus hwajinpoensis]|uniref:STAS domain-containing protein n=1 Tax=Guptibacillus hwajinpoensis TaxID=208199 RepID=UPI00188354CE|nr:STAS domain-containing protein [Pseudalkalibacillus hwajinpoensis]MBF0708017.1 STAS domain-containing protein [Pseudalkalibacillus hwajinpoensis]